MPLFRLICSVYFKFNLLKLDQNTNASWVVQLLKGDKFKQWNARLKTEKNSFFIMVFIQNSVINAKQCQSHRTAWKSRIWLIWNFLNANISKQLFFMKSFTGSFLLNYKYIALSHSMCNKIVLVDIFCPMCAYTKYAEVRTIFSKILNYASIVK